MRTHTLEFEAVGSIILKRPQYREMREVGRLIEDLLEANTPSDLIYSDEFLKVMKAACATEEDVERLMDLDPTEVWEVWTTYLEFARFDDFFANATDSHLGRKDKLGEQRMRVMKANFDMMKKSGIVPADFSFEGMLNQQMTQHMNRAPWPSGAAEPSEIKEVLTSAMRSSSTSSPPSTDGPQRKSKK